MIALVLASTAVVMLVDLWHEAVAGTSFTAQYMSHPTGPRFSKGAAQANDWTYLPEHLPSDWPWWPFVLFSVLLVAWKRMGAVPALI